MYYNRGREPQYSEGTKLNYQNVQELGAMNYTNRSYAAEISQQTLGSLAVKKPQYKRVITALQWEYSIYG